MKILFYLTRFPGYGGIETVTELIGLGLVDEGYELDILTHLTQERHSELALKCNLYIMPEGLKWNCNSNRDFAKIIMSNGKYDVIVYQDSYAPSHNIVCSLAEKFSVPLFVFEHNTPLYAKKSRLYPSKSSNIQRYIRNKILFPIEDYKMLIRRKKLLKYCKQHVLLSDTFIKEVDDVVGSSQYEGRNKLMSIHNPINTKITSIENKSKQILYVGRLDKIKRVDEMLYIWQNIENQCPDWQFVIVGDGPENESLKLLSQSLRLKNVVFEGFQNPSEYYKNASIFFMTSIYEGWPMTIVESMSYGCVPIAYDSFSSLRDIIDDNECGFIVENFNQKKFISTTINLIKRKDLFNICSKKAYEKSRVFNVENIVKNWISLLNS
jgi:glycosyltransferase involved in cell wall biosynthesis